MPHSPARKRAGAHLFFGQTKGILRKASLYYYYYRSSTNLCRLPTFPITCVEHSALRQRAENRFSAIMLDAQKAALQNTIRQRLVAIREHRHLSSVAHSLHEL